MGLESLAKDAKATEDYTKEADELLVKVDRLIAAKRYDEVVEEILVLEKKCRQAYDAITCSRLVCKIVQMYKDAGMWNKVRESIETTCKKRGQLRRAITDVVLMSMKWLDELPKAGKLELIETLNGVTEGKIFVEVERARLVMIQAKMKEEEGDIAAASSLLQEVQVETFGTMDKHEKANYILEQMRLVLAKKDFIRAQIASRKINTKLLEAEDMQEIKLAYYKYMVEYWLNDEKYLEIMKCYKNMFSTKCVETDETKWKPFLQNWMLYLLLSPYNAEQKETLEKTLKDVERKKLEAVSPLTDLCKEFLANQLITWPLKADAELKKCEPFTESPFPGGKQRYETLRKRVVQHNIRIMAMYYQRVTLKRMESLVQLDSKELEKELSGLVIDKTIYARIDRPAGIVKFGKEETSVGVMDKWATGVEKVLDIVNDTYHLIQKERMIREARTKLGGK